MLSGQHRDASKRTDVACARAPTLLHGVALHAPQQGAGKSSRRGWCGIWASRFRQTHMIRVDACITRCELEGRRWNPSQQQPALLP